MDNTAFSLPRAEGEILSLETQQCVLAMGGLCSEKQHKWNVAVFSDRLGPVPAVLQKEQRGKVGSNHKEVSDHDARNNEQPHIPSCQRHFLKAISF